ncbi:MAG: alpha/beta hydrolase [Bryobacteraceae bacterium]|nr:alpha/beta hydrolase [Bryobacteraceae bacterium]
MLRAKDEGRLRYFHRFCSRYLSTSRDLVIYLPPGYDAVGGRYPVMYLQDGQNLFDPATAYGGNDWRADVTADYMIREGRIPPVILAGIYNTGAKRISEYTPTRDKRRRKGGKADRYAQMLAREIKPFIDREFRTLKAASHTAVCGSSLGGLVSLETSLLYPRVFGNAAVISPSVWWDNRAILDFVQAYNGKTRPRIWLDVGTHEGDEPHRIVEDARMLRETLLARGWESGKNLTYYEIAGASHNEHAWAARFGAVLLWLWGRQEQ